MILNKAMKQIEHFILTDFYNHNRNASSGCIFNSSLPFFLILCNVLIVSTCPYSFLYFVCDYCLYLSSSSSSICPYDSLSFLSSDYISVCLVRKLHDSGYKNKIYTYQLFSGIHSIRNHHNNGLLSTNDEQKLRFNASITFSMFFSYAKRIFFQCVKTIHFYFLSFQKKTRFIIK